MNWTNNEKRKHTKFIQSICSFIVHLRSRVSIHKSKWTGQDDNKNDCTYINIRLGIGKFLSNSRSSNLTRLKIKQKTKQQPRTRAISNDNGNTEQVLIMSKTNRNNEQWMEREKKTREFRCAKSWNWLSKFHSILLHVN